jgi:hypothetical protein
MATVAAEGDGDTLAEVEGDGLAEEVLICTEQAEHVISARRSAARAGRRDLVTGSPGE